MTEPARGRRFRKMLRLFLLLFAVRFAAAAEVPPLTATDYQQQTLHSWTIHVEKTLLDHPRLADALGLLDRRLGEVEKVMPAANLPELRKVPIWLSRNSAAGACYHPSADWLRSHGRVVEMARSIELQNIDHFLDWSTTQPLMILHELSHAWHDRVLDRGFSNADVLVAFKAVSETGIYAKVRHAGGDERRHYALTNAMEYFAECSEAYFGRNDFQPFDRAELKTFDPAGERLVKKMWNLPD